MERTWNRDPRPAALQGVRDPRVRGEELRGATPRTPWAKTCGCLGLIWLGLVLSTDGVRASEPPPVDAKQETVSVPSSDDQPTTAGVETPPPSGDETTSSSPEERRQLQVERNLASVQRNIWWNRHRVIDNLNLKASQRLAMDRVLDGYLRGVLQVDPNSEDDLAFRQALADGDWDSARQHLDTLGDAARQRGMAEGEMMLQVLGELTSTQLEILRQRHGPLLKRSWIKLVSNQRGRAGLTQRGASSSRRPGAPPGSG